MKTDLYSILTAYASLNTLFVVSSMAIQTASNPTILLLKIAMDRIRRVLWT